MAYLPAFSHVLPEAPASTSDLLAALLKAAADPLRLDILRVLTRDSFGVLELCRLFNHKQSGMSHHLKVMTSAGLLTTRREGNSIFYRRAHLTPDHPLAALQQQIFTTVDQLPVKTAVADQLVLLQQERATASQTFFIENAHKFRAQQDLIASYSVYAEQITQLLNASPLPACDLAVEVGPGEGEFLPVLAQVFKRVIALDNAPSMLEKSRDYAAAKGIGNIEFMLGNTSTLLRRTLQANCIVINMVMHHIPSPADVFQELARVLGPKGVLLMTDLCRHEQTWARDTCGDLWQGFDPEELSRWARAAGLEEGQSSYVALRNGFQIQLRQFFKIH